VSARRWLAVPEEAGWRRDVATIWLKRLGYRAAALLTQPSLEASTGFSPATLVLVPKNHCPLPLDLLIQSRPPNAALIRLCQTFGYDSYLVLNGLKSSSFTDGKVRFMNWFKPEPNLN
jgi:hypothetical protein